MTEQEMWAYQARAERNNDLVNAATRQRTQAWRQEMGVTDGTLYDAYEQAPLTQNRTHADRPAVTRTADSADLPPSYGAPGHRRALSDAYPASLGNPPSYGFASTTPRRESAPVTTGRPGNIDTGVDVSRLLGADQVNSPAPYEGANGSMATFLSSNTPGRSSGDSNNNHATRSSIEYQSRTTGSQANTGNSARRSR